MAKGICSVDGCERLAVTRGWCDKHYQRWRAHGDPASVVAAPRGRWAKPLVERFWLRVDVRAPDDCWEWTGPRLFEGYGNCGAGAYGRRAHRVAYLLTFGPIPDGLVVCHRCDNPPCCNPGHLFVATQADNVRDMIAKGRYNTKPKPESEVEREQRLRARGRRSVRAA